MVQTYRTALINRPFMYIESKRIAELILQKLSFTEIEKKVLIDDLLQLPSLDRRKTILREIMLRLSYLDDNLLTYFTQTDGETAKLLLAYGLLQADDLFFEFMREIYLEKILLLDFTLEKKEISAFFERKAEQSPKVAKWATITKIRLVNGYMQTLNEIGLVEEMGDTIIVKRAFMEPKVEAYLKKNGTQAVTEIILGELL
ncbi:DUF1819 family protein [Carnobacterium sp.]|uniref:DUF1819 family protein n=1 Tax=Carnobacterium sp. TaxID=48221 RepID=UPI002FC63C72